MRTLLTWEEPEEVQPTASIPQHSGAIAWVARPSESVVSNAPTVRRAWEMPVAGAPIERGDAIADVIALPDALLYSA